MPTLTRGYLLALLSAAILSTTAIFIRFLTRDFQLPPLLLAFWRDGFVASCLLPVLWLARPGLLPAGRRNLGFLAAYGLALAIFNSLWTLSVALNGAAVATVLAYCSAAFTALLGWWLLKERLDWAKSLAVAASLAGCVLVSGALDPAAWTVNLIGILTGLFSGLFYAIYSLMGRAAAQRGLNAWTTLLYTFGFAAGFLFLFNLLPGDFLPVGSAPPATAGSLVNFFWLDGSLAGWAILFVLAAGPTLIGFGVYNMSLGLLPSSVANLVLTLEPVFTAAIAYFLLREVLTGVQVGGSLLIIAGVAFLRVYEGWLERQQPMAVVQREDTIFTSQRRK